jgi:hypothetical protein
LTAVTVRYFDVTFLGVGFVKDASPRGREAAGRHAEEVKKDNPARK